MSKRSRAARRERLGRGLAWLGLAGLVWVGARGLAPLPPLGPLLEPMRGVWALARAAVFPGFAKQRLRGLGADVTVIYDDRAVPHIFATSESDAYRALGFVTARDRLFQLDLQARAGGGTLTELLGSAALDLDRDTRQLGMSRAAEGLASSLSDSGDLRRSMDGYAEGVNAYLDGLTVEELPLEYRLLGRRPTRWSPLRSFQVLMRMDYTLTLSQLELAHERAAALVGRAAADALFPLHSPIQEPIQPAPDTPRRVRASVPPPGLPDSAALALLGPSEALAHAPRRSDDDDRGSNNWAVAPGRTRAGAALLAGDPHLDLTLPSIWYEAHLVVPDSLDVYGVTVPGLPAVLIGFNRDVAWTFTNVEADLMDRYVEEVDDPARPARYRLDGAWAPLERRAEVYRGPDGAPLAEDTLRLTHRGPLRRFAGAWYSLRWTALESGAETATFHRAAHATTAREWLDAMAAYRAPPQNMLVADRAGTIAIRSTGRFPIRPGDGRGDWLRDGRSREVDWTGNWTLAEYPHSTSPGQEFLASANQEPQEPAAQPRYLGADWIPPWRALRINALLRADSAVTPDAMRRWQTDPASTRAGYYVPYFVRAAATRPADTALAHAARLLQAWDRRYTRENEGAVLFEAAMTTAGATLWDELAGAVQPGGGAFIALLDDPDNRWWDVRGTTAVERRDDLLAEALTQAYQTTVRTYGPPEFGGWRWSAVHRLDIWHLLRLPALSRLNLDVTGGPSTISPTSTTGGSEGASWRMVVELGREVRAWGTYPGGQSGNPASRHYDDRLAGWQSGQLDTLRLPRIPAEVPASSRLVLTP
jgi:penicillin G amidase